MLYQLVFYVPLEHCEAVKNAIFEAGAGQLGDYEACAWQVCGQGQFRAKDKAKPYVGAIGQLERIQEMRVECVVKAERVRNVLEVLIASHPFEEPAYGVWPLMTLADFQASDSGAAS